MRFQKSLMWIQTTFQMIMKIMPILIRSVIGGCHSIIHHYIELVSCRLSSLINKQYHRTVQSLVRRQIMYGSFLSLFFQKVCLCREIHSKGQILIHQNVSFLIFHLFSAIILKTTVMFLSLEHHRIRGH